MRYVFIILAFIAGWFVGYGLPQKAPEPETIYVNKYSPELGPIAKMGSKLSLPARQNIRYKILPIEKLKVDTVYVPRNFTVAGVINNNPITFTRSDVILTYFDTEAFRFEQISYQLPQRNFSFSLNAHAFTPIEIDPYIGLNLNAHYRRLTLGAGAYLSYQRPPTYLIHIKYNIL